uniref:CD2 molecule n=1 Tax=Iconisemion striatum TaxID=60296 RepID=A0A1A7Z486_9TELE
MISVLLLLVVSLLDSAKGLEHQIVKYGTDILLDAKVTTTLPPKSDFYWKHENSNNVVKFNNGVEPSLYYDKYRAEFFKQNYSLLLKNVEQNYSGLYKAVYNINQDQILVEYNITVQDPVSPVQLMVTKFNSSDCNLTVTCRTEDSSLSRTFQCNKTSCLPQEAAPISLSVYLQQDHILCNHSNQVSWKQDTKDIKAYCEKEKGPSTLSSTTTIITSSVLAVVVAVALVAAVVCVN